MPQLYLDWKTFIFFGGKKSFDTSIISSHIHPFFSPKRISGRAVEGFEVKAWLSETLKLFRLNSSGLPGATYIWGKPSF